MISLYLKVEPGGSMIPPSNRLQALSPSPKFHFRDEEAEGQRGGVTCPQSHG